MTDQEPHVTVAERYLTHKGYQDMEPVRVIQLEGQPCWYFYYELPEGILELEVFWDARDQRWSSMVTAFPASSQP